MFNASRKAVMDRVRSQFLTRFETMVREMLSDHPFLKGQCIPTIIAERVSTQMNAGAVERQIIKHHWVQVSFEHKISTPIPSKPRYGMPRDEDVVTTTRFKVTAESAFIVASYDEVDEDGRNMGSEVRLFSVQRPELSNEEDDDDDEGTS
ncbi:hypothetical protein BRARA_H01906 [Brassica rapa]|uniref:Uncharacterized protein n=2 Tax=Brassica TaxID=3705 RepID=A0A397YEC6_BRACM|nr:hypothetical protein BRARA_H01906 [Brassica rapa]CAF2251165.1 unnamed protein product [Brassica napus]CAG7899060.1 unnamed protein product [Brassica rapa]VDD06182.1 unnamed protein product [Brassica rapa]